MTLTTDPTTPGIARTIDEKPVPQADVYLVLSAEERAKGFFKPVRDRYTHTPCGTVTTMGRSIAETYAREPFFYSGTYCVACSMHRPLSEFTWLPDGEPMSPHDPKWIQPIPQKET